MRFTFWHNLRYPHGEFTCVATAVKSLTPPLQQVLSCYPSSRFPHLLWRQVFLTHQQHSSPHTPAGRCARGCWHVHSGCLNCAPARWWGSSCPPTFHPAAGPGGTWKAQLAPDLFCQVPGSGATLKAQFASDYFCQSVICTWPFLSCTTTGCDLKRSICTWSFLTCAQGTSNSTGSVQYEQLCITKHKVQ